MPAASHLAAIPTICTLASSCINLLNAITQVHYGTPEQLHSLHLVLISTAPLFPLPLMLCTLGKIQGITTGPSNIITAPSPDAIGGTYAGVIQRDPGEHGQPRRGMGSGLVVRQSGKPGPYFRYRWLKGVKARRTRQGEEVAFWMSCMFVNGSAVDNLYNCTKGSLYIT